MRLFTKLGLLPMALALIATGPPPQTPPPPGADSPKPIAVAIAPGPLREPIRKALLKAYAQATGTELGEPGWDGSVDGLKKLAALHQTDLALLEGAALAAACKAQIVVHLDWKYLDRDRFLPVAASDCGAGAYLSTTLLAWDRAKLVGSPGWADFWDVTKHPGRRGLRRMARGNLEIALLADGVAAGDIYRTLRSNDGVDRAFRKLDQLKPYIVWWDQPSQPAQLLGSAKVLLTSAVSADLAPPAHGQAPHAPQADIGLQWTASLTEVASWSVLKDAPHAGAALTAILIATDPARSAEFALATGLGPSTSAAFGLLPAAARAQNPGLPANLQAGLAIDEGFWLDNGDRLEARFAAWMGK
jgi:putative spermidine/putrescine transport system substrate-binding protein